MHFITLAVRRARIRAAEDMILDAYHATEREAADRDLTPAQREAAALLHDEWRYLVHSIDGLNY